MKLENDSVVAVGQLLKCVNSCDAFSHLIEGEIYCVSAVYSSSVEFNGNGFVWRKNRFETVETVEKAPFTITVRGITMEFDATIPKSRTLVDAMLDVIYKNPELVGKD